MNKAMSCGIVYNSNEGKQPNDGLNKLLSVFTTTPYAVAETLRWVYECRRGNVFRGCCRVRKEAAG